MIRVDAGSEEAAWELVETYGPHIKAVVRQRMNKNLRKLFDSDDFVQAVWASFIRIRPKLHDLDDSKRFIGLLARMATHSVIDEIRRGNKTPGPPTSTFSQTG